MTSENTFNFKLPSLPRDGRILFATRMIRLFAYGCMAVVLALYLMAGGFTKQEVGRLISFTLLGDIVVTLFISTSADQLGRRRMLMVGAALMVFAGLIFAFTRNPVLLFIAAFVGVVSPNGLEIGPFLSLEQASLTDVSFLPHRVPMYLPGTIWWDPWRQPWARWRPVIWQMPCSVPDGAIGQATGWLYLPMQLWDWCWLPYLV